MSMRSRSIALGVVLVVALLTHARDEPVKDAPVSAIRHPPLDTGDADV